MPKLFDRILLKDGRIGTIAEVLEAGVAYEFEYSTRGDGTGLDVTTISIEDVDRVLEVFDTSAKRWIKAGQTDEKAGMGIA